ncbi:ABC transporter ATP-binding protein [Schaalia sp. Marseille-Q2122]|uniref:ABC transporter ATP-binding protein n=1 Tax=Schaalia sp. Marseille-Q2122 TaxID=2736604 RepID=UPI00158E8B53|nr:ABC transporter ATP-binding protein [Schaalia sp. Marseille-Q2122]
MLPEQAPSSEGHTTPSEAPLATAADLAIRYHGAEQWVPQPCSLTLQPGQVTLLAGPSGCGKSSLTLAFNGIVPHSIPSHYRGSLRLLGEEVADASPAHLAGHVALVLQDPDAQILTTRVWDEVCYALENLRLPQDEIDQRAHRALKQVGVAHLAERNPWHLSGGQRQRVILAAALAMHPRLLVLDEPTANLDPQAGANFYALLPDIVGRGTAVLVVEHNLDPVIAHVDHMLAFDADGRVIAEGAPREVFSAHAPTLHEQGIRLPSALRFQHALGTLRTPSYDEATAPGDVGGGDDLTLSCPLTIDEAARAFARQAGTLTWDDPAGGAPTAPDPLPAHTSASRPLLEVDGLHVTRGRGRQARTILHDLSFHAHPGQIIAVAGINGSGKSTLLRALSGVQPWKAGRVLVDGKARHPRRPNARVTLVPQNPEHQFLEGTVAAELGRGLRIARRPAEEIERTVARLLEEFSLSAHADANPFTLSGGQKRRLTVASALAEERHVICLDEPTFGQDHRHALRLMDAMVQAAARGAVIVVATHDLELISEYADAMVLLGAHADGGDMRSAFMPAASALADTALLEAYGLMPTPLAQMTARAREYSAVCPQWSAWKEVVPA